MRIIAASFFILCFFPFAALGADNKDRSVAMIEAARLNIASFKAKAGDGKAASTELGMVNGYLAKAEYALEKGKNFLGMVSEEAQQDIRHLTALTDIAIAIGNSKMERSRVEAEYALLSARLEKVKARVKVFDDYRAEIARLKAELARSSAASKELESLQAEKAYLQKQVEKLTAEKELVAKQLEEMKKTAPHETAVPKAPQSVVPDMIKPQELNEILPQADRQ